MKYQRIIIKLLVAVAFLIINLGLTFARAQQSDSATAPSQGQTAYSFALVAESKVLTVEGDWKQGDRLREYAAGHPGTYIVFTTDTGLSLLKRPDSLSKALALYDELARLGKEQEQREAKQAPLAKRQQELSDRMKKAGSPEEMRRIAGEQAPLGGEQEALGREQREIGLEQHVAGLHFHDSVEASLRRCTAEHSCF